MISTIAKTARNGALLIAGTLIGVALIVIIVASELTPASWWRGQHVTLDDFDEFVG